MAKNLSEGIEWSDSGFRVSRDLFSPFRLHSLAQLRPVYVCSIPLMQRQELGTGRERVLFVECVLSLDGELISIRILWLAIIGTLVGA